MRCAGSGRATSAYGFGSRALFAVDSGALTAVYRFVAADADAAVELFEPSLLATLTNTGNVALADDAFGNSSARPISALRLVHPVERHNDPVEHPVCVVEVGALNE